MKTCGSAPFHQESALYTLAGENDEIKQDPNPFLSTR
jgi:hypothetical protein